MIDFIPWNRYEIRDIHLPPKVQEAMQMQVEAEVNARLIALENDWSLVF